MKNIIARFLLVAIVTLCHSSDICGQSVERSGYQIGKTWIYSSFKNVQNSDGSITKELTS